MNHTYVIMIAACMTGAVTMFFHMKSNAVLDKTSQFWFSLTFGGIVAALLTELLGDWLNIFRLYPRLHMAVKVTEFCITPWLSVFMSFACGLKKYKKTAVALLFIHMAMEILLLPSGKLIFIDGDSVYRRGEWYMLYVYFYLISFIYLMSAFYGFSKNFPKKDRMTLVLTFMTLLTALIPHLTAYSSRTAFLGVTMAAMILYSYYEGFTRQKLSRAIEERNGQIQNMQKHIIIGVADLIESRDSNTGTHIKNTSYYVEKLANRAAQAGIYPDIINERFINLVTRAAPLHDVGKIAIPDAILRKPGKLTDEEFEIMKTHAAEGGKIILQILSGVTDEEYTKIAFDIAKYHHEKWNGKGYPEGLSGEKIPLCARIMALADVYDALTMERPYKKAFPAEKALSIIEADTGTHFDPVLAPIFMDLIRDELSK